MNKQLLRFTFLLFTYLVLPLTATAQVVDLPDANLRAAIEAELGKTAGAPITANEIATLTHLEATDAGIKDLTGLEFATNLTVLYLWDNSISDLSPLADLTKLEKLGLNTNLISDISPLARLTQVRWLRLQHNSISDISSLAGLTQLQDLAIYLNSISNLSPLTGLTQLKYLDLGGNLISDLSPLAGLTNLEHLHVAGQPISNLSPLSSLTNLTRLGLWHTFISDLSPLVGLIHLEFLKLHNNSVSDLSPLVVNTGLGEGDTIWVFGNSLSDISINTHIPALRRRGVTVHNTKLFFPTINPVSVGDTFTLSLVVEDVIDLAGWQLNIEFNPAVLKTVSVTEGDFLAKGGRSTFFASGNTNNIIGEITEVTAAFIGTGGISGTGALLEVTFEAKAYGEGRLGLENVRLGDPDGNSIPHELVINSFNFKQRHDVNGDGNVNIFDLVLIVQNFNQTNPQADVNGDGDVNIFDLILVAQHLGESATGDAPGIGLASTVSSETIQTWIDMAHAADDGSLTFRLGIANLERILMAMRPGTTALLGNYPNPFNPETWIPYQLAHNSDVTLTIYDTTGALVRQLELGYQQTGYYTDRTRAAYWDGRNNLGESVGSGVYFYQLQAKDFSAMRKMVILK